MTLIVCFLSFHYVLVYLLNFHYVLVYLLNYEFVDVWFLSQLYLKLGPGFNSILVPPLGQRVGVNGLKLITIKKGLFWLITSSTSNHLCYFEGGK